MTIPVTFESVNAVVHQTLESRAHRFHEWLNSGEAQSFIDGAADRLGVSPAVLASECRLALNMAWLDGFFQATQDELKRVKQSNEELAFLANPHKAELVGGGK